MVRRVPITSSEVEAAGALDGSEYVPVYRGSGDNPVLRSTTAAFATLAQTTDTISPLDFGGQNGTDDSVIIQLAYSTALSEGKTVLIPNTGTPFYGADLDIRCPTLLRGTMQLRAGCAMTTPLATLTNCTSFVGQGGQLLGSAVTGTVSNLHGLIKVISSPRMEFSGVRFGRSYYGGIIIDEASPDVLFEGGGMKDISKHCIVDRSGGLKVVGAYFYGVGYGDGHVIRYGSFATDPNWMVPHIGGMVAFCTFQYCTGNGVLCETDSEEVQIIGNRYSVGPNFVKADKASRVKDVSIIGNVESDLNNDGHWDPDTQTWTPGAVTLSAAALAVAGMQYIGNKQFNCARRCDFGADAIVEGNYWYNCGDGTELIRFISDEGVGGSFCRNGGAQLQGYINLSNSSNVTVELNRRMSFASGKTATRFGGDGHTVRKNTFVSEGGTATGISVISTLTNAKIEDNDTSTFSTPISYGVASTVTSNRVIDNVTAINPTFAIASGVISVFRLRQLRIDTEGSAATDDVDTITPTSDVPIGWVCRFTSAVNARDPTLKNGTGNLVLASDCTLLTTANWLTAMWDGSAWKEINRG